MSKVIQPGRKSDIHRRVKHLLEQLYPSFRVEEERRVETRDGSKLPVDLLLPMMHVAVECHGVQHFQYTPFFHKTPEDLADQKRRDRMKAEALQAAGWSVVVVRYDEYEKMTTKQLAKKILAAIKERP